MHESNLERRLREAARVASWQLPPDTPRRQPAHESDTYQAILDEGHFIGAWECILDVGEVRGFGPPEESVIAQLISVADFERLERMLRRAVKAENWQEILDTP